MSLQPTVFSTAMKCPICKRPVTPQAAATTATTPDPYPFCSQRCKLIDLGRWLDGRYQIPVEIDNDNPDEPHEGENP